MALCGKVFLCNFVNKKNFSFFGIVEALYDDDDDDNDYDNDYDDVDDIDDYSDDYDLLN